MLGLEAQTLRRGTLLELTGNARAAVRIASREVAQLYARGGADAVQKADGSPLTQADLLAHRILSEELSALSPSLPVVSEEDEVVSSAHSPHYWLIDPIDGTKEFLAGNGEFSVNAALISGGAPVWGCVSAPANDKLYEGGGKLGSRIWEGMRPQTMHAATASGHQCRVLVSRSHLDTATEKLLDQLEQRFASVVRQPLGSSLKFCALAEGSADLYPRMTGIYPWDLAAGQAVLEGAGGGLLLLSGKAPVYRSDDRNLLSAFVACADLTTDWPAIIRRATE